MVTTIQSILQRCDQINEALHAIKKSMQQNKQLLTIDEFCSYTGFCKNYVYYLTSNKLIRHFKPKGKIIFIDRNDADKFIRQNEINTVAALQAKSTNHIVNKKK